MSMLPPQRSSSVSLLWLGSLLGLGSLALASHPAQGDESGTPGSRPEFAAEDVRFFEERIRPALDAHCYRCHGPDAKRARGGLRFGSHEALLRGGDSGPAVVPGDPDASRLVQALRWSGELEMPPDERLDDDTLAAFERWVLRGAAWPGHDQAELPEVEAGIDYDAGRQWWSFQPITVPERPTAITFSEAAGTPGPATPEELREPLDSFVLARLAAADIRPNGRATERELVRRVYVDLIGLPPTYAELEDYLADTAPDRWTRLVDGLLARPEYGEHWASFWLDLVRFAQTNGYERDAEKPYAWRYRNWIIQAFNEDLPYDDFLRWQLAGDELDEVTPHTLVATGFYRVGPWDDEPDDPEQARYDELDDFVRVVGEGFLGLTIGCARCHDHKFDPISQDDYTGMVAVFNNVLPYEDARFAGDSATLRSLDGSRARLEAQGRQRLEREQQLDAQLGRILSTARAELAESGGQPNAPRAVALHALESDQLREYAALQAERSALAESFEGELPWALTVREAGTELEPTHLLVRGNASSPAQVVAPHVPRVLCPAGSSAELQPEPVPRAARRAARSRVAEPSSGARRALAEWITRPEHPLTPRVIVNRVWQQHFGRGLVPSPNDFGRSGEAPSHPELLDWLSAEFVADGWSLKRLHRRILHSSTWQRSSRATNDRGLASDPANELLWRQNPRRLEAEVLRDAMLSVSGELVSRSAPGSGAAGRSFDPRGFFPLLSEQALAGMSRPAQGWGISGPRERSQRAVHSYVKRGMLAPFFTTFDFGDTTLPIGRRLGTNIATQAMTLLNGEFANLRASAFTRRMLAALELDAERLTIEQAGAEALLELAWKLALGRLPEAPELELARRYLGATERDLARQSPRLVFAARVPPRVSVDFLNIASGEDLSYGPRPGWKYLAGLWEQIYNGTLALDETRGPISLFEGAEFSRASLELELLLGAGVQRAGLVFGARESSEAERWSGLQLLLDPGEGALVLLTTPDSRSAEALPEELARWALELPYDEPLQLRLELDEQRLAATFEVRGELHEFTQAIPGRTSSGKFGVRVWGGTLELAGTLSTPQQSFELRPQDLGTPAARALESLCLMLFNFNEFLYVD